MDKAALFGLFADALLIVHFAIAAFIVSGLPFIVVGRFLSWEWIYNKVFRIAHLGAIAVVILQAWLGRLCPLTSWEQALREQAGQDAYAESFIQHWLHRMLFFEAELWVFGLIYTLFGGVTLACWLIDRKKLQR